jgi:hypothetical protein
MVGVEVLANDHGLLIKNSEAPMTTVNHGDILIRDAASAFELLDATTLECVETVGTLYAAIDRARERGGSVWRQNVDNRGRALGEPFLLVSNERAAD